MHNPKPRRLHLRVIGAGAAVGAAIATALNVAIYQVGRAAGVVYVITETTRVQASDVVVLSAGSFLIGTAAAAVVVAAKWDRRGLPVLQLAGAVVALISTFGDFSIDGTATAKVILMTMHLVVGLVYVTTLQVVRSRSQRSTTEKCADWDICPREETGAFR